ncbi:MAG: methyltransferase domain-containing protein [Deltaproteobacteria bacterium]|nr:methyltransferase domain-containing protein [Deltaproteobacteria bacterium]
MSADIEKIRRSYDIQAKLYDLREIYLGRRARAVRKLEIKPGAVVMDLACGTGLNLPHLVKAVGEKGLVIGVDYSEGMLAVAHRRVEKGGWKNVRLIHEDALQMNVPYPVDAVLCAYAVCVFPEWEAVLHRAVTWIRPGGRLVVLDVRYPEGLLSVVNPFVALFGKYLSHADYSHEAWKAMKEDLKGVEVEFFACRTKYLCWGVK